MTAYGYNPSGNVDVRRRALKGGSTVGYIPGSPGLAVKPARPSHALGGSCLSAAPAP
jgi:hypothetical protein